MSLVGRPNREPGFTVIELAFILGMIVVLAGLTHGSVKDLLPRYRMIQVAKDMRSDIHALRFTAIEQNREVRVHLVSADPDWSNAGPDTVGEWWLQVGNKSLRSNAWDTLPVDMESDGSDDQVERGRVEISHRGEDQIVGVSLKPWGQLSGPGAQNLDSIVFSPRGYVINPASDFDTDGYITLTLVNKRASAYGLDDSVDIRIARSGMVRMESSLGPEEVSGSAGVAQTSSERGGS